MAASNQSTILREYLVALGFVVDETGAKKVENSIDKLDRRALNLAKGLLAVGAAAKAMVTNFAFQMEKLYYSSQRAESSASKIKSIEYAWRQLGGSGDAMRASVEGMASALRQNPGLVAVLENLGVKVQGRDRVDVLNDFVRSLRGMPHYIAAQYAKMFGMDPDTLYMIDQNLDKFQELQKQREQMARDMGVDLTQAAAAGQKYASTLRELGERVGLLGDALSIKLLPYFQVWADRTAGLVTELSKLIGMSSSLSDFATNVGNWLATGNVNGGVQLSAEARARLEASGQTEPRASTWLGRRMQDARRAQQGLPYWGTQGTSAPTAPAQTTPAVPTSMPSGSSMEEKQAYLASLEQKYGLPQGWLDRVWNKESLRGHPKYMMSPKGAEGHFQFMPITQRHTGLKNPYDFHQSADASARYFKELFQTFGGDRASAAAAYNWGPGNVRRYGLGGAPRETRDYVKDVAGVTIMQNNPVTITGVTDPAKAAQFASDAQRRNNADVVRDLKPNVR